MKFFRNKAPSNHRAKIVFFGTSEFAVSVLNALEQHDITPQIVVTTPTRPSGRELKPTPPPVYTWAKEHGVIICQPEHLSDAIFHHCLDTAIKDSHSFEELRHNAWDLFIVADYGKILPMNLITLPKHGTINIHPSLLPKLRGSNPIRGAILGETETGVSIIEIDEKVDHGPILARKKLEIPSPVLLYEELEEKLAMLAGDLLSGILPAILSGDIPKMPQEHNEATYTQKTEKEDALLTLDDDPERNYRKYSAYHRSPRSYFFMEKGGQRLRVIVIDAALEDGKFVIKKVLPEGRGEMSWDAFVNGYGDPREAL